MIFSNNPLTLSTACRRWQLFSNQFYPVPVQPGTKHPSGLSAVRWTEKLRADPAHYCKNVTADQPHDGLFCDGLRAVDADIDDPDRANAFQAYITDQFGVLPTRFRDSSPRKLYLLRAAEGLPPKRYVRSDLSGEQVEVLGHGNQFHCFGIHPKTGEELRWTASPLDIRRDELVPVTEHQITALLDFAADLLGVTRRSEVCSPQPLPDRQASSAAWPIGDLRAALNIIPCPAYYGDWFRITAAAFTACDGSTDGYAVWLGWCANGPRYEKSAANNLWFSLYEAPAYYTAGTLVHEARKHDPYWDRLSQTGFQTLSFKGFHNGNQD